ncbi:MAG: hypothetical protein U5K33_07480 [Halofilum sp. (in: g-proteobacteria)]|nr:hypothetical protein [Halofilum sp. (in: g-proteobacteria)]
MRTARLLRLLGGSLLLAAGLLTLPLPVPVGMPLSLAGLGLLVAVSPQVRGVVTLVRGRFPKVSGRLDAATPHLPRTLARLVRSTSPVRRARLSRARPADPGSE